MFGLNRMPELKMCLAMHQLGVLEKHPAKRRKKPLEKELKKHLKKHLKKYLKKKPKKTNLIIRRF